MTTPMQPNSDKGTNNSETRRMDKGGEKHQPEHGDAKQPDRAGNKGQPERSDTNHGGKSGEKRTTPEMTKQGDCGPGGKVPTPPQANAR